MSDETVIIYDKRTDDLLFEFLTAAFDAGVVNAEESFRLNQFRQKFTVQVNSSSADDSTVNG